MNHAGALKKKLIVILNDNNMSISPNVGGLSEYMSLLVTRPGYVRLRKRIKGGLSQYLPTRGQRIIATLRRIEDAVKSIFTSPSSLFEGLGFKYLGPFDGHDANLLIDGLRGAARLDRPVLFHVVTVKGKGYQPAEDDPCGFHGVGRTSMAEPDLPSEPDRLEIQASGKIEGCAEDRQDFSDPLEPPVEKAPAQESFSAVFGRLLMAEAEKNPRITAVSAAMSDGTGLSDFFKKYPDRSFDVGIAEQHAVTMCAGLAVGGFKPVAAIYSSFLQRSFDQLFHDVALQNLPVVLAVDRAGLVGEDGPTHHGGLDLSFLRVLPNFTVMAPADAVELEAMLKLALSLDSPSAIRYPRGPAPRSLAGTDAPMEIGRAAMLRDGADLSIIALGLPAADALAAAEELGRQGISAAVINARFIKPLDERMVLAEAARTGRILTVEENTLSGGLFGAVSEVLAGQSVELKGLGLTDEPVHQASQKAQRASLGLDAPGIVRAAKKMVEAGRKNG